MSRIDDSWAAEQRRRWMRPNAHLWIRPDAYRFMAPGAPRYLGKEAVRYFWPDPDDDRSAPTPASTIEQDLAAEREALVRLRSELAALKAEIRFRELLRKAGFNPDQPRVPAGNRDGGQWTREGEESDLGISELANSLDDEAILQLAGDITGFTKHGINQAISRGVRPAAILDAVVNPLEILPQPNGTIRHVGRSAVVVLDPAGRVITVWGR